MVARQRPPHDREVFGKEVDRTSIDGAPAGDNTIAGHLLAVHAEIVAIMLNEHVELFEAALIQQQADPLTSCELSLAVLSVDPPLATT